MSACSLCPKPNIEDRTPRAAIIAPPGTPGAATIITPSIKIKPKKAPKSNGIPVINISATAHATIFNILPDKWIVAQSGTTKPAIALLTPFFSVCFRVTGMVAADEDVPSAVKYAGIIFAKRRKGFLCDTAPAAIYCSKSKTTCITKMIPITEIKTEITRIACPVCVILKKMPKM